MNLRAVLAVACSLGLAGYQCVVTKAPVSATSATPGGAIDINETLAMAKMLEPVPFDLGAARNEPVTPCKELAELKRPATRVIASPPAPPAKPSAARPAAKARTQTATTPRPASSAPRRASSAKTAFQQTASPMSAALNRTFHSRPDFGLGTIKARKPAGRTVRTISR